MAENSVIAKQVEDWRRVITQCHITDQVLDHETGPQILARFLNEYILKNKDAKGFFFVYRRKWGSLYLSSSRLPAGDLVYMMSDTPWPPFWKNAWTKTPDDMKFKLCRPESMAYSPFPSDAQFMNVVMHLEAQSNKQYIGPPLMTDLDLDLGMDELTARVISQYTVERTGLETAAFVWCPEDEQMPLKGVESLKAVLALIDDVQPDHGKSKCYKFHNKAWLVNIDRELILSRVRSTDIGNVGGLFEYIDDLARSAPASLITKDKWWPYIRARAEWLDGLGYEKADPVASEGSSYPGEPSAASTMVHGLDYRNMNLPDLTWPKSSGDDTDDDSSEDDDYRKELSHEELAALGIHRPLPNELRSQRMRGAPAQSTESPASSENLHVQEASGPSTQSQSEQEPQDSGESSQDPSAHGTTTTGRS